MESNEKKLISAPICSLHWTFGVEISKIREDLDMIEKLGATHININYGPWEDEAYCDIDAVCQRLETDEECARRLAEIQQWEDARTQRELDQLKNLRAKYNQ